MGGSSSSGDCKRDLFLLYGPEICITVCIVWAQLTAKKDEQENGQHQSEGKTEERIQNTLFEKHTLRPTKKTEMKDETSAHLVLLVGGAAAVTMFRRQGWNVKLLWDGNAEL